ncbi:MAG TPA: hypothetical protein VK034_07725 [Enhygromyxa sp.]|nr:hypothetical protein [Enhygromyxa sp.]
MKTSHIQRSAVALAAALSLATPFAHASEPAAGTEATVESQLTIAVELDAEADEQTKPEIVAATEAELANLEQQHGLVRAQSNTPDLLLRVRIWQPEPNVLVIDSSVEFEGEVLGQQEGVVCMDCSVKDAAAKSMTILPAAVEQARAARAASQPPPPVVTEEQVDESAPVQRRTRALGPVGYVGIAASVLGLGSTIVGTVYLYRGKDVEGDPGAPVIEYTNYIPLGLGLIGAGVGVMVVGNVLLGVDLGILRTRREQRASARARITRVGLLASHEVGLTLSGQF